MVAVSRAGCAGGVVGGCAAVAGGGAVLQAEGLEAHLVILGQDGPHL